AVEHDGRLRVLAPEAEHAAVVQGRDLAVLPGAETLEPGLASVHHEDPAAGPGHRGDEALQALVVVLVVDPDAALHGHRHMGRHGRDHGRHAVGHPFRLAHQTGTKGPLLHALAGAAAVEVDLVVAGLRA